MKIKYSNINKLVQQDIQFYRKIVQIEGQKKSGTYNFY